MGHTKEHTNEPWRVNIDEREIIVKYLVWGDETPIADMCSHGDATLPDAHRIVTCVNACAGLSNDEVKRYGPKLKVYEELADLMVRLANTLPMGREQFYQIWDILNRIEGKEGA